MIWHFKRPIDSFGASADTATSNESLCSILYFLSDYYFWSSFGEGMTSVMELDAILGTGKAGSDFIGGWSWIAVSRKRTICFWEFEIMRLLQIWFGIFVFYDLLQ